MHSMHDNCANNSLVSYDYTPHVAASSITFAGKGHMRIGLAVVLKRTGVVHALIAGALLGNGAEVEAQQRPAVVPSSGVDVAARVKELHERAEKLHDHPRTWVEASRLHRAEAKLRDRADPKGVECLRIAAMLLAYAGRDRDSRYVMEEAANWALEQGDAHAAATAYLEAAFIAKRERNLPAVNTYLEKSRVLSVAPGLTTAQKEWIAGRIKTAIASEKL